MRTRFTARTLSYHDWWRGKSLVVMRGGVQSFTLGYHGRGLALSTFHGRVVRKGRQTRIQGHFAWPALYLIMALIIAALPFIQLDADAIRSRYFIIWFAIVLFVPVSMVFSIWKSRQRIWDALRGLQ